MPTVSVKNDALCREEKFRRHGASHGVQVPHVASESGSLQ